MRGCVVVVVLLCGALSARAQGEKFAVLPTDTQASVQAEATLVESVLVSVLTNRSLVQVPPDEMRRAAERHGEACNASSLVACATVVGNDVGATKVVVTDLYLLNDTYELSLLVVDLRSSSALGEPLKVRARDRGTLLKVAEGALLDALHLEAFGEVTVRGPVGADVVIDGVARDALPQLRPVRLVVGRHTVEVRLGSKTPWQGFVQVEDGGRATLTVCATDAAVTACDGASDPSTDPGPSPLLIGGLAGAGAGVVGVGVGAVLAGMTMSGYQELRETRRADLTQTQIDSLLQTQTAAVVCFAVGTTLVAAGAGASIAAMLLE